jgi:hypothetical protein
MTDDEKTAICLILAKAEGIEIPTMPPKAEVKAFYQPPDDYFSDLNACARVEATLGEEERKEYLGELSGAGDLNEPGYIGPALHLEDLNAVCFAPASVRAPLLCKIIERRK